MFINDIKRVIEQVSKERGIDSEFLITTLKDALKAAAKKKHGINIDIEVNYNEETGELEVFEFKDVVENVEDDTLQISMEEALELDPDTEIGDSLGRKIDASELGRIAAQSAKQVIIQRMKNAEKEAIFSEFVERKGEIINGIVLRRDKGNIIVNLGKTEATLPVEEQMPQENYKRKERVRAYILDVLSEGKGPQVILSRTHPNFLIALFKAEAPEISEGTIKVVGAVREPGKRAKIAVSSENPDIDPVGSCVGLRGSRVQNVVQELKGEKIDIIKWSSNSVKFVCNAMAPADIVRVIVNEASNSMEMIVSDDSLPLAIGKKGQNIKLAAKLTGWNIDVKNESAYSENLKDGYASLMALEKVGSELADKFTEKGFFSAMDIVNASIEDIMQVEEISEEEAEEIIKEAKDYIAGLE
ncbi:MAG: transcription termination/antitermination protein NusA [Deltaproteobacteria bacterium]|nr:transcription termination/antitermination protein NusA [Deltaproteobacteria bacterium]